MYLVLENQTFLHVPHPFSADLVLDSMNGKVPQSFWSWGLLPLVHYTLTTLLALVVSLVHCSKFFSKQFQNLLISSLFLASSDKLSSLFPILIHNFAADRVVFQSMTSSFSVPDPMALSSLLLPGVSPPPGRAVLIWLNFFAQPAASLHPPTSQHLSISRIPLGVWLGARELTSLKLQRVRPQDWVRD